MSSAALLSSSASTASHQAVAFLVAGDYFGAAMAIALDKGPWSVAAMIAVVFVKRSYIDPAKKQVVEMVEKAHVLMDRLGGHMDAQEEACKRYTITHEAYKADVPALKLALVTMQQAMEGQSEDHKELMEHINRLTEGKAGALTDDQLINLSMVYTQKVMWDILIWWQERLAANGMAGNEERVKGHYNDFLRTVRSKFVSQFGLYRHEGVSLDRWVKDGVDSLLGGTLRILWEIQVATATSQRPRMQGHEIAPWLSHRVSAIQGAARVWITDGRTLGAYLSETQLDTDIGEITWLKSVR